MTIRRHGGPGEPLRWRGFAPMAPEPAAGATSGAEPKTETKAPAPAPAETKPAPAPAPAKTVETKPADDVGGLLAALKAEREALAAERASWLEERKAFTSETTAARDAREREIATQRRAYARSMGLAVDLADDHLDALLPRDVDVRTDAGKSAMNKWREDAKNARLFRAAVAPATFDPEKFATDLAGGEKAAGRFIFGPSAVKSLLGAEGRE